MFTFGVHFCSLNSKDMFRVFFILWCLSWPVSVLIAMQEPFGSPHSQLGLATRAFAAGTVLAFYVCAIGWLIHRTRRAFNSGSTVSAMIGAWVTFVFLSPLGPLVLLFSERILRTSNAAT